MLTITLLAVFVAILSWLATTLRHVWHSIPRSNADFDLAGLRWDSRVTHPNPAVHAKHNPAAAFYGKALVPRILGATLRTVDRIAPRIGTRGALGLFFTPMPWKLSMRSTVPSRWRTDAWRFEDASLVAYCRRGIDAGRPAVLLVHGWAGSGAQLFKLGDALADAGFDPVLLDFPAHGRSAGWQSTLPQFQRAIYAAAARIGPLHAIVAHSLGAIATMHAVARGLGVTRLVLVAPSASPVQFLRWFAGAVGLRESVAERMRHRIEARERITLDEFEPEWLGPRIHQRVLVIHDENDRVAPLAISQRMLAALGKGRLMTTQGLGHRRVLDDRLVADEIVAHLAPA